MDKVDRDWKISVRSLSEDTEVNIGVKCLVLIVLLWAMPAMSETRRAFVVGIDQYDNFSVDSQLSNAVSDATAVAMVLRQTSFDEVTLKTDISRFELYVAWQEFLETIDQGDTVAFYYSGHGVAIEGNNYLLPRSIPDIEPGLYELIKSESMSLNSLLSDLDRRDPGVTVVILDACRNDPFANGTFRSITSGGLARAPEPPTGTFIMYSAAAGRVALDNIPGDDGNHSVYTKHLLELLPRQDMDIATLSRELRQRVNQTTRTLANGFEQSPAYYDGVLGEFCFAGCMPEEESVTTVESKTESNKPMTKTDRNVQGNELVDVVPVRGKKIFPLRFSRPKCTDGWEINRCAQP